MIVYKNYLIKEEYQVQYYGDNPYMPMDPWGRPVPDPYMPDPYRMPQFDHCWRPQPDYCWGPQPDPYSYPQNFPMAIALIKDAVSSEREDELFYDYLLKVAPSEKDKEIIKDIRDDERKHSRLFREIYCELTGQTLPPPTQAEFTPPASYCAGLQQALFGELGAVEKYRMILFAMQDRVHINKMTEIITDELKHANKWNYLYSKNECFEETEEEQN
jgi:rubrerythrin